VAWFLGQSFVVILLAFLLGLLVGWLWWGRPWRGTRAREAAVTEPAVTEPAVTEPAVTEPVIVEPVMVEPAVTEPAAAELTPEPEVELTPEPVGEAAASVAAAETAVPVLEVDDLERIEGIGPRMAGALHQAGIRTYRQLADSDDRRLRAAIEAAGLRFAPSLVTWARQARLLADGDEAGFADLARRLVAGRDTGRS
jgi:predicted flap endonuclease-1-like 5' DNA nuclease